MAGRVEFVRALLQKVLETKNFAQCLKGIQILSADNGKCRAQFTVTEEHLNVGGTLHGGFTATVIDCISSYALIERTNILGLSVDMHITYLKAAFPGDVITIDAKTIRAGKKLAFLEVELTKNDGKDIIARGQHTKYVAI